ncbi:KTSC domain-containing protein [Mucilaginibacter sp. AW1-7]|uniref:KTSC domain-containing protein n=1 Tax=unclassified Mucilaginibacter TaxID=2617802 RepID=UPI0023665D09|nr:KTSC domain-containing protein [Mucilaginibacter sp. KACC 22773]WDF76673.1 KTSC domain-containing protein [Mucilaginibacter sp. KACC 22773]
MQKQVMQRQSVQSSALNSAGYDPSSKILELEFRDSGGVWQYFGVSNASFKKFMGAESLGHFFVTQIKGKYPEIRIR